MGGLIQRLFGRPPETRAAEPSWGALRGWQSAGGQRVDPSTAEGLSVVLSCVGAISGALASLPAFVYRRRGTSRVEAPDHDLARLIRTGVNPAQNWCDLIEWVTASCLLRGNALVEVITSTGGTLTELRPIPWTNVATVLLPSGRLAYDVSNIVTAFGGTGRMRRLLDSEVIHVRDRSDDGLVGRSRLSRAAAVVGASLATQEFASNLYVNGAFPSGTLETTGPLGEEGYQHLRRAFTEAFTGPRNAAKALILEAGIRWNSISISPEDAELLASRKYSGEELARLFNVPPPLVGIWDHSSFTNSETAGRWFAQHTLAPWIAKLEAAFGRSVLGSEASLTIDMSGFLKGDPAQRWAGYGVALTHGVLSVDEVRQEEGWNPKAPAVSPTVTVG